MFFPICLVKFNNDLQRAIVKVKRKHNEQRQPVQQTKNLVFKYHRLPKTSKNYTSKKTSANRNETRKQSTNRNISRLKMKIWNSECSHRNRIIRPKYWKTLQFDLNLCNLCLENMLSNSFLLTKPVGGSNILAFICENL